MIDDLFPYTYRPYQREIVHLLHSCISSNKHVIIESGSGTGKTICSLVSSIPYALDNNKKITYLTRTNSQQIQVIREVRKIRKKMKIRCACIQGRNNMCLLSIERDDWKNATAEELSILCKDLKKEAEDGKGCQYYRDFHEKFEIVEKVILEKLPTSEELIKICKVYGICPYEVSKRMLKSADVVVCPYIFFFNSAIRIKFIDWISKSPNDLIVIIDEAHNLPDYIREMKSGEIGLKSIIYASEEAYKYGLMNLLDDISVEEFCRALGESIKDLANEYIKNEDSVVPHGALEEELMSRLTITSLKLNDVVNSLLMNGLTVREIRRKAKLIPRSYMHSVASFLNIWMSIESKEYIKIIKEPKNPRLEIFCLDPSIVSDYLTSSHSTIHMSGTLSPLEEYRDSTGLPLSTYLKVFPSPFPPKNKRIVYVDDVTTRYEELIIHPEILDKYSMYVSKIAKCTERSTAFFFSSYELKNKIMDRIKIDNNQSIYMDDKSLSQRELMEMILNFKDEEKGAKLFSVAGGRVSEGLDFPGASLEVVVLVGLPYPKPTKKQQSLQYYYDLKFGKGWEYTVRAPTARKVMQAIGRLIRSEWDRGIGIILDSRAVHFKDYIPNIEKTDDPMREIREFFGEKNLD